jgi:hypothetical protein
MEFRRERCSTGRHKMLEFRGSVGLSNSKYVLSKYLEKNHIDLDRLTCLKKCMVKSGCEKQKI